MSSLHHQRFYERGVLSLENGCVAPIDRGGHKKILRDSAKNPTKSIKIRCIPENFAGQGVVRDLGALRAPRFRPPSQLSHRNLR